MPRQSQRPSTDVQAISGDGHVELTHARLAARAWSKTVGDEWRVRHAALFAWTAIRAYAEIATPETRISCAFSCAKEPLDADAQGLARAMGREAAKLPMLEALHHLTSLYPALLPQKHRSEIGAFYTPPCLTARLLDLATEAGLDWVTARILDPAAGGGAFLLHSAIRMKAALSRGEPAFILAQIGSRLAGLERDANAASLAQVALEIALSDLSIASGRPVPTFLRVCDTLEEKPRATFDLVVGNPPYGRLTLNNEQRQRFKRGLYGHANLYGVFTDIALRWTKPGRLIAYITPTSMLGGQYYAALRGLLAKEAPPISIDFVHARHGVFEDVLQETLLALYRRGASTQRVQVHYLRVQNARQADFVRNGTIRLPRDPCAPWLAPRDPQHSKLIAHVERMPCRLADWGYEVSTGPLVWNRFKPQLREKAGPAIHPLIWAEAVTADGQFLFRAEKRNHAPYFKMEAGDDWLLVERACVLLQRTTAKEQHRRLIAAELPQSFINKHEGVVVENHLNMIRSKGSPKVSTRAVAAILNSKVVDEVFRCISGSVAVSAFELEAVPMPSVEEMKPIEALLAKRAQDAEVEAAIAALYGRDVQ